LKLEAVLFDLDGLMIDSEPVYARAWKQAAQELGGEIDQALERRLRGRNNRDCEAELLGQFGPGFPLGRFHARWQQLWLADVARNGMPTKPGLRELLENLERRSLKKAVATSTDRTWAERSLEAARIAGRFDLVVTGDEIERGKPAPDIFLEAARGLGVDPGECLVLEDTNVGVQAARAAGALAIMVPDLEQPDAWTRGLAWRVVPSLHEVRHLLAGL